MVKEPEPAEKAEPEEVDDGVDLEDMEVSFDDAKSEEETLEETSEEASKEEPKEESTDDAETEAEEDESEESEEETEEPEASEETEEPKETDDAQMSDEERKQHNREMAEKRIREKQQREANIEKELNEYVVKGTEDDGLTPADRQQQVDVYRATVNANENLLKADYRKALVDFPVLSGDSPEIKAEINATLLDFRDKYITVDEWDNPSQLHGDLYSILKTKAESIERLTKVGAKKEASAKSKTKANTLTPPSRTPKEPKKDEMLEGFDEEMSRY